MSAESPVALEGSNTFEAEVQNTVDSLSIQKDLTHSWVDDIYSRLQVGTKLFRTPSTSSPDDLTERIFKHIHVPAHMIEQDGDQNSNLIPSITKEQQKMYQEQGLDALPFDIQVNIVRTGLAKVQKAIKSPIAQEYRQAAKKIYTQLNDQLSYIYTQAENIQIDDIRARYFKKDAQKKDVHTHRVSLKKVLGVAAVPAIASSISIVQAAQPAEQTSEIRTVLDAVVSNMNVRPPEVTFQTEQQPIPTATLTPGGVNIRQLPTTEAPTVKSEGSTSQYTVLGYVTENNFKWYYLGMPQGGYGWVRSDVVPVPDGQDVWDLTGVASIPMGAETPVPGETLVNSNVNLAIVKATLEQFASDGMTADSFTPENVEVLAVQGQDVILQLKDQINTWSQGTVITIIGSEIDLKGSGLVLHPNEFASLLQSKGIPSEGNFSAANTPDTFIRFGSDVVLSYESALTLKKQGLSDNDAVIQSLIFGNEPFPSASFNIQSTGNGANMNFDSGDMYTLSLNKSEGFLRATKLSAEQVDQLRSEPKQMTPEELGEFTSGMSFIYNNQKWEFVTDIPGLNLDAASTDRQRVINYLQTIILEDKQPFRYQTPDTVKIVFRYDPTGALITKALVNINGEIGFTLVNINEANGKQTVYEEIVLPKAFLDKFMSMKDDAITGNNKRSDWLGRLTVAEMYIGGWLTPYANDFNKLNMRHVYGFYGLSDIPPFEKSAPIFTGIGVKIDKQAYLSAN